MECDNDFDFNDAVIRIQPDDENETCGITLMAVGSSEKMYLHYDGPDGGEPNRDLTGNRFAEALGNKFVVSYFGNMGTVQDVDTILGAVRLLKEEEGIFFLFAGHGNKLEALKQAIAQEGLKNAQVLDYLHGKDYRDALQISGAALISLESGTTGLCVPSKTYSYMMEGIPLIAIMDDSDIVAGAAVPPQPASIAAASTAAIQILVFFLFIRVSSLCLRTKMI